MAAAEIGGRLRLRGGSMLWPMASVARASRGGCGGEAGAPCCEFGPNAEDRRSAFDFTQMLSGTVHTFEAHLVDDGNSPPLSSQIGNLGDGTKN